MSDSADITLAEIYETARRITVVCPGCQSPLKAIDGEPARCTEGIELTVHCSTCDGAWVVVRIHRPEKRPT